MTEGLQLSIPRRMVLIRVVLTVAVTMSMLFTKNLWIGPRTFPRLSVLEWPHAEVWEIVAALLAVLALIGSMIFRWQRVLIAVSLVVFACLITMDLTRLQPWMYFYLAMLLVFVVYNGRVDDPNHYTSLFVVLQLVFVAVYIFSGWSLLKTVDPDQYYAELLNRIRSFTSDRQFAGLLRATPAIPWIVIFTGFALLTPAVRYLALSFAVTGHAVLLWLIFPAGPHADVAAWFVNAVMLALLPLLCSGQTKERHFSLGALAVRPIVYLYAIFFYLVPAYAIAGSTIRWPRLPGMRPDSQLTIVMCDPATRLMPPMAYSYIAHEMGTFVVDYRAWSRYELRSEPCSHPLAHDRLITYLNASSAPPVCVPRFNR